MGAFRRKWPNKVAELDQTCRIRTLGGSMNSSCCSPVSSCQSNNQGPNKSQFPTFRGQLGPRASVLWWMGDGSLSRGNRHGGI